MVRKFMAVENVSYRPIAATCSSDIVPAEVAAELLHSVAIALFDKLDYQ